MTDNEITKVNECKTLAEGEKIKAIYPHIVVGGQTGKPCYSIQWYDIEKQTMLDGYASYKLEFVKKWLQENFEEIEFDIGDLINRQKAEIDELKLICDKEKADRLYLVQANEALIAGQETLQKALAEKNAEIERLQANNSSMQSTLAKMSMGVEQAKAEAIKEFAERLKGMAQPYEVTTAYADYVDIEAIEIEEINNLVKEMTGDTEWVVKKGCEYCKGRAYTKKPLTVITRYGRRIELTFEYCPKCGRKLNTEERMGEG